MVLVKGLIPNGSLIRFQIVIGKEHGVKDHQGKRIRPHRMIPQAFRATIHAGIQRAKGGFKLIGNQGFVSLKHPAILVVAFWPKSKFLSARSHPGPR
jgi:hypothetical protein